MTRGMSEADWEALALDTLGELGWKHLDGKRIAPGSGERESWSDLLLRNRLRDAIERLNPQLPASAVDEAVN
ncbi:MAG: type I restriction endonuclease, partial [Candidatus Binatia bacterium]